MRRAFALLLPLALLAACSREEEPVAEKFERQQAEIENRARALEAQVENEVAAAEARLDAEGRARLEAVNAAEANESAPAR